MKDCIFCKIAEGKFSADKIYEDKNVFAFLDISPVNFGHALVIPKKHFENLNSIDEGYFCDVMKISKKISDALIKSLKADGTNITINNGKAAGQLVPHLHVHIIPRFSDDKLKYDWPTKKYPDGEMKKIADKLRKNL